MVRTLVISTLALCTVPAFSAQDVASAIVGSVKTIDRSAKVVVVDTKDGAEHTFHYTDTLAVHVADGTRDASKDTL